MPRSLYQSPTPASKAFGYGHSHDSVAGLQIIQYRSYQRNISIFHLRLHLLPLDIVRKALQSQKEYVDRLTSFDPLRYLTTVEGDDIPPGCIEAAYVPGIVHGHGSALALRSDQEDGKVEWFIFSGPIDDTCLSRIVLDNGIWSLQQTRVDKDDPRKLFDLVGCSEKGLKTRTVRGANREHKGWHDSLCAAEEVKKSVKVTWKGFGKDLRAEHEQRRRSETVEVRTGHRLDSDGDILMGDEGSQGHVMTQVAFNPTTKNDIEPPQPPQRPSVWVQVKKRGWDQSR